MRIGPRKKLAALGALVGIGLFALAAQVLDLAWVLTLLAAGIGATFLAVGLLFAETQRQQRATREVAAKLNTLNHHLNELRSVTAGHSARLDDLGELGEVQARQESAIAEIQAEVNRLGDALRLVGFTLGRERAALAWLRAEVQHLSADGNVPADGETEAALLRSSDLFDPVWYETQVQERLSDPVVHYLTTGARAGLDPHPLFSTTWYLERHPEALLAWRSPLGFFLAEGAESGHDPHPAFRSAWYADRHLRPDDDTVPVVHYLREGALADLDPNPLFRSAWYREAHGLNPETNPLIHYLTVGAHQGHDPSPLFDSRDVGQRLGVAGGDPLSVFLDLERDPGVSLTHLAPARPTPGDPEESELKWEYLSRGLHHQPDTFVVYRIIGNDLPPRHREGQSLDNLRFILEHEPDLPGAEKRWVVNRIIDPDYEKEAIALLEEHERPYLHIPFVPAEYRQANWRFQDFEVPGFTYRPDFDELGPEQQLRALDHVYHDKNLYVMNNNGARNAALREGRTLAKWVLPWDGNCFLPASAWAELVESVSERSHLKYFTVPMARVTENQMLLRPDFEPLPIEEPQILFRADAIEKFDEDSRYGRRSKVNLFYRLGVPGRWDRWVHDPWDGVPNTLSPEAGQFGEASWVARLSSGREDLDADIKSRGLKRIQAIRDCINELDQDLAKEILEPTTLLFFDGSVLEHQRIELRKGGSALQEVITGLENRALKALDSQPYTVVSKTTLPPSGDPHDYWHPAPYWWPNPDTPDGLPYVYRDGQRAPGTILWEPGSEQYDRSSLQSMIDDTTVTALTGYFTGERRYFERAAKLLKVWFLEPSTRMNPHLRYSQVRMGYDEDQGIGAGIIEAKDLHYLLDAVKLLEHAGILESSESETLREWFAEYRSWLRDSEQGRVERASLNNHGTWYDVQVGAIDAYLYDIPSLLETLRRSHERIGQQFTPDGRQPEELARKITQHYCTYNLQGWLALGTAAARAGQDLFTYQDPRGPSLDSGIQWVLDRAMEPWPFEQFEPFDHERFRALACEAKAWLPDLDDHGLAARPSAVNQQFSVHYGVRPFWLLGGRSGRAKNKLRARQ